MATVWHYFNPDPYDDPVVLPSRSVFEKAVKLLLPDLSNADPRFDEIVNWAQRDYTRNGKRLALLARVDGACTSSLSKVSNFLRKLDLDPGRREVIVNGYHVMYTHDYKNPPVRV